MWMVGGERTSGNYEVSSFGDIVAVQRLREMGERGVKFVKTNYCWDISAQALARHTTIASDNNEKQCLTRATSCFGRTF